MLDYTVKTSVRIRWFGLFSLCRIARKMSIRIPFISTQQIVEVDRLMIEEYDIQLIQMVEITGRNLAELSRLMLGGDVRAKRLVVLCGSGNNGGGGMVAARHLHNWGAEVLLKVFEAREQLKDIPVHQLHITQVIGISDRETIDLDTADLILDAMIGYGVNRRHMWDCCRLDKARQRLRSPCVSIRHTIRFEYHNRHSGKPLHSRNCHNDAGTSKNRIDYP
jgi:NAD(P)H-hydrate epimerase